jgi:alkylation response protein AidB-like acyl-CoA dehydrogenase
MSAHALGANPFADTEDQAALRQLARDVAERELAPMARHGDETEEFPQWAWDGMRKAELFGLPQELELGYFARLLSGEGLADELTNQAWLLHLELKSVRSVEWAWEAVRTMIDDRFPRQTGE